MVPSGPSTPLGGQSMSPSLLRSNSGMLVGQGAQMPPQAAFSSLMPPRNHYNNGSIPSVSSLLNQSFGNGGVNTGGSVNNRGLDANAEADPLSGVANGMGFNGPSSSFVPTSLMGATGQVQIQQFSSSSGSQLLPDQSHTQQPDPSFQHNQQQFTNSMSNQHHSQQQQQQLQAHQFHSTGSGMGPVPPVKLEQPVSNDQHGPQQQSQQQLQSLRGPGVKTEQQPQLSGMRQLPPVKMESQHSDSGMRQLPPVKMEPQHSDQPMLLPQQRQHLLQMSMSRQGSKAAAAAQILQQQRLLQLQQQQQHPFLKTLPQQRSQVPQQFQPQNMVVRPPLKPAYEPGTCARRLTHYMYQQQHRPEDNGIEFWRKFVSEYFAPNAKKKWCVSMYGTGRQPIGIFPQDVWHCEICNRKPGCGFEATFEVLPRLFKTKYESGTLEELLYVDMPREYHNTSGQIVLDYAKAIHETVFEQLRVVRDGQLRIVFSPDLKICSWEFCARKREDLVPRRLLIPQVCQFGSAAQKYQSATQNASSSNLSVSDLQNNCNTFVASARQLAKTLEVPLVNDLGYTKRYVRCLQISEVVNSMKDLIDYSRITGTGPMESLAKFPRRISGSAGTNQQSDEQQQPPHQPPPPQQQAMVQNKNSDQATAMQIASSNGVPSVNNTLNASSASTSASTIAGMLHQNSMNARQQNALSNANSPYGGNSMPSPGGSSGAVQQMQTNPSSFQSPTPSASNNLPQTSHSNLVADNHLNSANSPANMSVKQPALSGEGDANDSRSSVQKILHEMMMSSKLNGAGGMMGVGSLGNELKNVNGVIPQSTNMGLNGANCLMGNVPIGSNSSMGSARYGGAGGGISLSAMANGMRTRMGNNPVGMSGRGGLVGQDQSISYQQQDMGSQLLSGINGFNSLQFDWKPSP